MPRFRWNQFGYIAIFSIEIFLLKISECVPEVDDQINGGAVKNKSMLTEVEVSQIITNTEQPEHVADIEYHSSSRDITLGRIDQIMADGDSNATILIDTANQTMVQTNETVENATSKRVVCLTHNPTNTSDQIEPVVRILNNTEFQARLTDELNSSVSNRSEAAHCSITFFYAPWCEFSAAAAPHFNALARVFPDIKMYAVDSSMYHSLNTQYGVMALPSVLMFHNSRPLYKYNYTEYTLDKYSEFVTILTGIHPLNVSLEPREEDFAGPVPTKAAVGRNYYLVLAIIFSLLCGLVQFSKSPSCERMIDTVRNAWREAEIQHEHNE